MVTLQFDLLPHIGGVTRLARLMAGGILGANAELRRLDRASRLLRKDLEAWLEADERGTAPAAWPLPARSTEL